MKKLLLSMALVATASACFADDYELYISTEAENGDVTNFALVEEGANYVAHREAVASFPALVGCDAYVKAVNNTGAPANLRIEVTPAYDNSVGTAGLQICIGTNCRGDVVEETVAANSSIGGFTSDHIGYSDFIMSADMADALKFDSKYNVTMSLGNVERRFTITFSNETASVGSIDLGSAEAEYFNLQGLRVANPEKGEIYIVRQGGKVSKAVVR